MSEQSAECEEGAGGAVGGVVDEEVALSGHNSAALTASDSGVARMISRQPILPRQRNDPRQMARNSAEAPAPTPVYGGL